MLFTAGLFSRLMCLEIDTPPEPTADKKTRRRTSFTAINVEREVKQRVSFASVLPPAKCPLRVELGNQERKFCSCCCCCLLCYGLEENDWNTPWSWVVLLWSLARVFNSREEHWIRKSFGFHRVCFWHVWLGHALCQMEDKYIHIIVRDCGKELLEIWLIIVLFFGGLQRKSGFPLLSWLKTGF